MQPLTPNTERDPCRLPDAVPAGRWPLRRAMAGDRRHRRDRERPRSHARPRRALGPEQLRLLHRPDAVQPAQRAALDLGAIRGRWRPRRAPESVRPGRRDPRRRALPARAARRRRRRTRPGAARLQPLRRLRRRRARARPRLRRPDPRSTRRVRRRDINTSGVRRDRAGRACRPRQPAHRPPPEHPRAPTGRCRPGRSPAPAARC